MAYAQREGPYGGRRLAVPKPDFIPGGMTARTVGDRIRSQINPAKKDPDEERRRWDYEQRQRVFEAIAPKVDWANPEAVKGVQAFIESFAPTSAPAEPKTTPVTHRPGGRLVPTTRGRQEQGMTVRPGGLVMPTTRAVQEGAVPGQVGELGDWGKKEIARRAALVAATRARADEVARMKREGKWTPGVIRHEGMVIPEEMFEKAQREKRLPLARSPVSAQAGEDLEQLRAEQTGINEQLRRAATGVGIQEGPTAEQERLRARSEELAQKIAVAESISQQPTQRMTETPTMRAFDYTTQTLPAIRGAEEVDAEIKAAREEYQNITSGTAWDEARRAFRESTDMRSQQAAQQRLRELKGPEAKERARERLVALARERRDLEEQAARGPQAPSATALGEEQAELQTDIARRRPDYEAQRRQLIGAARAGAESKAAEIAAAQATAEAPTSFPAKPAYVPPGRKPTLDEARRQEIWELNKGVPFKDWSEEHRVGFGLERVERDSTKERVLQKAIDGFLAPRTGQERDEDYQQRIEAAGRALKAIDPELYEKLSGLGEVARSAAAGVEAGAGAGEDELTPEELAELEKLRARERAEATGQQ